MKSKPKIWTAEEDTFLRRNYPSEGSKFCSEHLGRTLDSVRGRIRKLGLKSSIYWTEKNDQYLREWYGRIPTREIAKDLNRSRDAVIIRAAKIGLRKIKKWTKYDDRKLIRLCKKGFTPKEIGGEFGISRTAILARLYKIHPEGWLDLIPKREVKEASNHHTPWTQDEDEVLREYHGKVTYASIGKMIDRTPRGVSERAFKLGLVVSEEDKHKLITKTRSRSSLGEKRAEKCTQIFGVNFLVYEDWGEFLSENQDIEGFFFERLHGGCCPRCNSDKVKRRKKNVNGGKIQWYCSGCRSTTSWTYGTPFWKTTLPTETLMKIIFYWTREPEMGIRNVALAAGLSKWGLAVNKGSGGGFVKKLFKMLDMVEIKAKTTLAKKKFRKEFDPDTGEMIYR